MLVDYFGIFKDYWLKLNMCKQSLSMEYFHKLPRQIALFTALQTVCTFLGPWNLFLYKNLFGLSLECKSQASCHSYLLWYLVTNVGYILQSYFKPNVFQIRTAPHKPIAELLLFRDG